MRKFGSLAMVALLATCAMTSCGDNGVRDGTTGDINITVAKLGYGTEWVSEIAEAYEKETDIKVGITTKVGSAGVTAIQTEMESRVSNQDIYITKIADYTGHLYKNGGQGALYSDLTDLYTMPLDGENGATIKSKLLPAFEEGLRFEDAYYALPWAHGVMGIIRNVNTWEKLGYTDADIPLTTNQMIELCEDIQDRAAAMSDKKDKDIAPFIYSSSDEYYSSVIPIFFAQYEGRKSIANFLAGKDPEGKVSYNLYTYDGQTEALNVAKELLDPDNGYQHRASTSMAFTEMQSYFLAGQAVFCVNGDWLEIEMGANYNSVKTDYIKFPVVSALVKRLSFYSGNVETDDQKLSELITFVDAHRAVGDNDGAPTYATPADVEIVRESRQMAYMGGGFNSHMIVIPKVSKNIEKAKDFLKFLYSDKGLNLYYKTMGGVKLPLTPTNGYTETVTESGFRQSVNRVLEEGDFFEYNTDKAKIFAVAGVSAYWKNGFGTSLVNLLREGRSVEEIMSKNHETIKSNWGTILNSIQ